MSSGTTGDAPPTSRKVKVKVKQSVVTKREIEVELPYYYQQDFYPDDGSSFLVGRVEESVTTVVHVRTRCGGDRGYELEVLRQSPQAATGYFNEEHRSTEAEFSEHLERMAEAINEVRKGVV